MSQLERIIFDSETAWSSDYTLTKLTYLEYIDHPSFQLLCGVLCRESNGFKPQFYRRDELISVLTSIDWSKVELICHNMHFDGLLLARRLGIVPARYTCTLSYSRYHNKGSTLHGLEQLCAFYGITGKEGDLSKITKGKRYEDFVEADWKEIETYTVGDGKRGTYIWLKLQGHVPENERIIQDMTFRMAMEPQLLLNQHLIAEAVVEAREKRDNAIGTYDLTMLRSRPRFAQALTDLGIDPPMKLNKKGEPTYAFSKKDEGFIELQDHHDERVRDLVEAKLAASSNIDLTRALRLQAMGEKCIVTLQPSGADTDRWSGSGGTNFQNLRRGGKLRRSITAPPGYLIFAPDQAQIEARINAAISGQDDLVEAFRQKRDVYSEFATDAFGYHVDRKAIDLATGKSPHELEGFVGKTCILGLGYMTGARKLQHTLATSEKRLKVELEQTTIWVNTYRTKNWAIAQNWNTQDDNMRRMCDKRARPFTYKWLEFRPAEGRVYWPDGSSLLYDDLHIDESNAMVYHKATIGYTNIYGGKAVEHHCQKTGNSIIKQNILDIKAALGLRPLNTTHDELMYLIPVAEAERYARAILGIMCTPKDWFAEIPIFAEGKASEFYSK